MDSPRFRRYLVLLTFLVFSAIRQMCGQTAPDKYWVQFTDKEGIEETIDQPRYFLSARAIQRRSAQKIDITAQDLPVSHAYIDLILALQDSIEIINVSKWFNAITIHTSDSLLIEEIANLPFVSGTRSVQAHHNRKELPPLKRVESQAQSTDEYGASGAQTTIHGAQLLHEMGFWGKGMHIAVLDAGFRKADVLPVFDKLHNEGRLMDTRDFVDGDNNVFHASTHGMMVLSTMAGFEPDSLIGTAIDANYYLYRTEDGSQENVIEEDNWIAAAEHADSIGVDLINTSLGYTTFDDSTSNYTYANMDGNTSRITKASDIAASKGILLVTSAGNSGNGVWHFIGAPGDADSVLTVGAVDRSGEHAFFSSFGPTADGRIKPDVMAIGEQSTIARTDSTYIPGNGTSFSAPIMCGLVACFWQAFPEKNNMEIIEAVKRSSSLYSMPNDSMGYGIPNFWQAFSAFQANIESNTLNFQAFPNPFQETLVITFEASDKNSVNIRLMDALGKEIEDTCNFVSDGAQMLCRLDLTALSEGLYYLNIHADSQSLVHRLLKTE
jgi:serine protease AprX